MTVVFSGETNIVVSARGGMKIEKVLKHSDVVTEVRFNICLDVTQVCPVLTPEPFGDPGINLWYDINKLV